MPLIIISARLFSNPGCTVLRKELGIGCVCGVFMKLKAVFLNKCFFREFGSDCLSSISKRHMRKRHAFAILKNIKRQLCYSAPLSRSHEIVTGLNEKRVRFCWRRRGEVICWKYRDGRAGPHIIACCHGYRRHTEFGRLASLRPVLVTRVSLENVGARDVLHTRSFLRVET